MLSRRTLIQSTLALSVATALRRQLHAFAPDNTAIALHREPGKPLTTIPKNFTGLGYEMSSAARLGLLSRDNASYVQLVRNLGRSGVLRLGGIVADFTSYAADGTIRTEPKNTVITRASLEQLRGFLDTVGWTAIWSLNFGRGTLDEAIAEARDVATILGPRLLCLELGNEVENYSRGRQPLRPPPYNYGDYRREYTRWRAAILAALPGLHFAAPDTSGSIEWVEQMATTAHGEVQLLTTHYYRGDQKKGTPEQLIEPDPELKLNLERLHRASLASGIPWRMCETNSFYGGGHPGLSDTLTGALWALDFMLLLAQSGCAGVNIETGVNQLGFISSYSPIQDDEAGHNTAGVPYYGMLAFAAATDNAESVIPIRFDALRKAFTAYGLGSGDRLRSLVLINKSKDEAVHASLAGLRLSDPSALYLTGTSPDSTTGITFGGAAVGPNGKWQPAQRQPAPKPGSSILVAPASAIVVRATDA